MPSATRVQSPTIDSKLFLFSPSSEAISVISGELEKGGLRREDQILATNYTRALHQVGLYSGKIPAAIFYLHEATESTTKLYEALRKGNSHIQIYQIVVDHLMWGLLELEKIGLIKLEVAGSLKSKRKNDIQLFAEKFRRCYH